MAIISVIIPVFNSEKYITRCLDSVCYQTVKDIEIIVINDGSTDSSPMYVKNYIKKDNRIIYITQNNKGAGAARNLGLSVSKGEFITFIDADDFYSDPCVFERMINLYSKHFGNSHNSFIIFNYKNYYPELELYNNALEYPILDNIFSKTDLLNKLTRSGIFLASPCFRLIPREFLKTNRIYFPEKNIGEDILWNIELIEHASSIKIFNDYSYIYRKQNMSSASTSITTEKLLKLLQSFDLISDKYQNHSEISDYILNGMAYQYIIAIGNARRIKAFNEREIQNQFLKLNWLLKYDDNPKVRFSAFIIRLFGLNIASRLLSFYITNKIIKKS